MSSNTAVQDEEELREKLRKCEATKRMCQEWEFRVTSKAYRIIVVIAGLVISLFIAWRIMAAIPSNWELFLQCCSSTAVAIGLFLLALVLALASTIGFGRGRIVQIGSEYYRESSRPGCFIIVFFWFATVMAGFNVRDAAKKHFGNYFAIESATTASIHALVTLGIGIAVILALIFLPMLICTIVNQINNNARKKTGEQLEALKQQPPIMITPKWE